MRTLTATPVPQNPQYEAHENPSLLASLGYGLQFSLIASATLLVTPVIVAKASGRDDAYLVWMVFASLLVCGAATLLQVRRLGPVGAGAVLPMFTAAFSIPFCITVVVDGGPATLTTLILVSAVVQIVISKWLFILRRIVTPTVGGTVMMILSITLASVVFGLLNDASEVEPVAAPLTALATLVIVAALALRGSEVLRLWAPLIGIVGGCVVAAAFGIYEIDKVTRAPWVGLPNEWPGLGLDFGIPFLTLLPAFLFLPELNEFIARFAAQRGWDTEMKNRLSAVAEETLLTLAPLDLSLDVEEKEEEDRDERRLVVVASSDGPVADLEFIGGGDSENIEDRVRQLQQHDVETTAEHELSLQLLRSYASSVLHQQYHDTDIITVRVAPPGTR